MTNVAIKLRRNMSVPPNKSAVLPRQLSTIPPDLSIRGRRGKAKRLALVVDELQVMVDVIDGGLQQLQKRQGAALVVDARPLQDRRALRLQDAGKLAARRVDDGELFLGVALLIGQRHREAV